MKISKIATATLVPAAIAGVTLPAWPAAQASTARPVPPAMAHQAGEVQAGHAAGGGQHQWVRVRSGDTLNDIAATHRMTWQAIYATPPNFRHVHSPDLLVIGQKLRIPGKPAMRAAQFDAKFSNVPRILPAAPAPVTPAPVTQPAAPPAAGSSAYQRCVAWRESGNNPSASSAGLYGILPSTWASLGYSGTAGQASVAQQNAAFQQLYAKYGTSPWSPYDGCPGG